MTPHGRSCLRTPATFHTIDHGLTGGGMAILNPAFTFLPQCRRRKSSLLHSLPIARVELKETGRFRAPATRWIKNCMMLDIRSHSSHRMLLFCQNIQNGGCRMEIFPALMKAALKSLQGITSMRLSFWISHPSTRPYPKDLCGNLERCSTRVEGAGIGGRKREPGPFRPLCRFYSSGA